MKLTLLHIPINIMDQIPVFDADGDVGPGETLDGLVEKEWTVAFKVRHSIITIIRYHFIFSKLRLRL